ncbi:ubiquitin-like modifier hub1 [Ancistrocladus abbreviatus]
MCWKKLVDDLESCSLCTRGLDNHVDDLPYSSVIEDGVTSAVNVTFMNRLIETGATESCSENDSLDQMVENGDRMCEKSKAILQNIVAAVDDIWRLKDGLYVALAVAIPEDGSSRQKTSSDLVKEVKNLRSALSDLHLKHRMRAKEIRNRQDSDVKNKADLKRLRDDLDNTISELEESNHKVAALKAEKDATKGAFFPVLNLGNKHVAGDRAGDKQKEMRDMESVLKEIMDQSSSRLEELKNLHEERIVTLKKLSNFQSTLKSVKCISSSKAFQLVREQLEKSKAEVARYLALFEKLQVEKDNFAWREREANIKYETRRCIPEILLCG